MGRHYLTKRSKKEWRETDFIQLTGIILQPFAARELTSEQISPPNLNLSLLTV